MTSYSPESLAVVWASPNKKAAQEAALVLRAIGLEHQLVGGPDGWSLLVSREHANQAASELRGYQDEKAVWPPKQVPFEKVSNGRLGALTYGLMMIVLFPIGQQGLAGKNWFEAGLVDGVRLRAGEWERLLTALTLHADLPHLAGNLLFGIGFGILASHTLGTGLAWFLALSAGCLGNWINMLISDPSHRSLGASTAVFGLLGVMSSYEWIRRKHLPLVALRRIAPLIGAGVLLGFLGMGNSDGASQVDIGAHVFGFLAGIALGAAVGGARVPQRLSSRGQAWTGFAACLLVAFAWMAALSR
jgi:membrane associated rhomboid family serine protease